jgi:hypothetical protein
MTREGLSDKGASPYQWYASYVDPARLESKQPGDAAARLEHLHNEMGHPYAYPTVLRALYQVAEQIEPHAHEYNLVVGEGDSSGPPLEIYTRIIDNVRMGAGLPGVDVCIIDGADIPTTLPDELAPQPADLTGRALLVTEYMALGASMHRTYGAVVEAGRQPASIDVATVGTSMESRPEWLDDNSGFFRAPYSYDVCIVLTGEDNRSEYPPTVEANTDRIAETFIDMLDLRQPDI